MAGGPRCPGMVSRAASPLELMVAWLQECSVTFPGLRRRLVDGPARSVKLKERAVSHREELFERDLKCKVADEGVRLAFEERTDGEDSILIDFCSFTRGRVAIPTPYASMPLRYRQTVYGVDV